MFSTCSIKSHFCLLAFTCINWTKNHHLALLILTIFPSSSLLSPFHLSYFHPISLSRSPFSLNQIIYYHIYFSLLSSLSIILSSFSFWLSFFLYIYIRVYACTYIVVWLFVCVWVCVYVFSSGAYDWCPWSVKARIKEAF